MDKFFIDFEGDITPRFIKSQLTLFKIASTYIGSLSELEQEHESEAFFVYLLDAPRRDLSIYLTRLLDYFHLIGLLKFKKQVYNDSKQSIVRHMVVFKTVDGRVICKKKYSSINQLSQDCGCKTSSIHYNIVK